MAAKIELTDMLTKSHFVSLENHFKRHFGLGIETTDASGTQIRRLSSAGCHPAFCKLVRSSRAGASRCQQDRQRSLSLAIETGQPYTCLCHAGIVLVCVPIMDQDVPLGGLFFGKCLWEQFDDSAEKDITKRLRGLRIDRAQLVKAASSLPIAPGRTIHEAAEFLFILLYETTELDPRVMKWKRQRSQQQSEISQFIQDSKKLGIDHKYPYESERKLIGKVKIGDRTGAKEILNTLLGTIMFHNPGNLNVLKARLVELLSILSRAAVEAGLDINLLLEKNLNYINKVMSIDNQQDICLWISSALDDFIDSVYHHQDLSKTGRIRPALEYIEINYDRQLTLAEIAKSAHLSISRLSHLFKEQMGITIIDYVTSVRIDHAKRLLLTTDKNCTEICFQVGYNNQSYFTRTFKELVDMTPRQFRSLNLRKKTLKHKPDLFE
jgi:two-component system response regulator YesN